MSIPLRYMPTIDYRDIPPITDREPFSKGPYEDGILEVARLFPDFFNTPLPDSHSQMINKSRLWARPDIAGIFDFVIDVRYVDGGQLHQRDVVIFHFDVPTNTYWFPGTAIPADRDIRDHLRHNIEPLLVDQLGARNPDYFELERMNFFTVDSETSWNP